MRNRREVNINNVRVGMRVKIALPAVWCQVNYTSPIVWMKGKIVRIDYSKKDNTKVCGISMNVKWNKHHHYFKLTNLWAGTARKNGVFSNIYQCK